MAKVLIVDDSRSVTAFLRDVLVRKGYAVHVVSDPSGAVRLLKNQKPDLVLAGMGVPRDAGWKTVESLKAAAPQTPLAVLSTDVSKDAEDRAAALGCAGFIYKDLKPEALLEKVLESCAALAPLSAAAAPRATKGRILIVDDEEVIRNVLGRFLRGKGYDVSLAANGREALEQVRRERPHLMLLDVRMPEMDGIEVLRRLRDVDREVAVMMITANTDLKQARQTMEMGACDYIVKPFHLDYLETTVMAKLLMVTA